MKVKQSFFYLFPSKLNENEYSALSALIGEAIKQTGEITSIFRVGESQYESLFGYGRDRTDQALTALVKQKLINREQKKDSEGKFTYNEIKIITDLVG